MITSRREFLKAAGAAAAGAVVFPAVARAQAKKGVPKEPVKIGVLATAGVTAPVGESGLRGTEWAVDRINAGGGIPGRKVELVVEEESNPKDTVERLRKLNLQDEGGRGHGGISTGVGLAIGPVAEEMKTPLAVPGTAPPRRASRRRCPSRVRLPQRGQRGGGGDGRHPHRAKYFKGKIKTVAGINNDYSYGRDNWATFQAMLKKHGMNVTPVARALAQARRDRLHLARGRPAAGQARSRLLLVLVGRRAHLLKQAHAVGLSKTMKGVFTTAGGVHDSLKKEFTPEGMLLGYNSMYFDDPGRPAPEAVRPRAQRTSSRSGRTTSPTTPTSPWRPTRPPSRRRHAATGQWPTKEQVAKALEGIEVESLSGRRSWREDHIQSATSSRASPPTRTSYDFATIDAGRGRVDQAGDEARGAKLLDWIAAGRRSPGSNSWTRGARGVVPDLRRRRAMTRTSRQCRAERRVPRRHPVPGRGGAAGRVRRAEDLQPGVRVLLRAGRLRRRVARSEAYSAAGGPPAFFVVPLVVAGLAVGLVGWVVERGLLRIRLRPRRDLPAPADVRAGAHARGRDPHDVGDGAGVDAAASTSSTARRGCSTRRCPSTTSSSSRRASPSRSASAGCSTRTRLRPHHARDRRQPRDGARPSAWTWAASTRACSRWGPRSARSAARSSSRPRAAMSEMGIELIVEAFAVVVIGGLGSMRGAAVGALVVGVLALRRHRRLSRARDAADLPHRDRRAPPAPPRPVRRAAA